MPIEIKELHIRVEVGSAETPSPAAPAAAGPASAAGADLDSLVAVCVEQVMQVLRDRGER